MRLRGPSLRLIAAGDISKTGVLADPALNQRFEPGFYDARFHVADYYRSAAGAMAAVPFLDVVSYRFGIADSDAHYHLPMKCTPVGVFVFPGWCLGFRPASCMTIREWLFQGGDNENDNTGRDIRARSGVWGSALPSPRTIRPRRSASW